MPDATPEQITGFIDIYRRGSFVWECRQGHALGEADNASPSPANTKTGHGKRGTAAFDKALERAFHQARGYITRAAA